MRVKGRKKFDRAKENFIFGNNFKIFEEPEEEIPCFENKNMNISVS